MSKVYNYRVVDNSIGVFYELTNKKDLKRLLNNRYYNNNYIIEYKNSYNITINTYNN